MTTRTFDRAVKFDERSRAYPIRSAIRPGAKPRSYTWRCMVNLDQGEDGACVGFSVAQEAAARPKVVMGITDAVAVDVYNRARQIDEWPGESYSGSSVLAGMKAGVERKWYRQYRWAFGETDLALAIGHVGPAVLGVNWHADMFEPDDDGFLRPSGGISGGHAILCNGYNHKRRVYRVHNSWGADWGIQGEALIHASDMAKLLKDDGEACVPLVRLTGLP